MTNDDEPTPRAALSALLCGVFPEADWSRSRLQVEIARHCPPGAKKPSTGTVRNWRLGTTTPNSAAWRTALHDTVQSHDGPDRIAAIYLALGWAADGTETHSRHAPDPPRGPADWLLQLHGTVEMFGGNRLPTVDSNLARLGRDIYRFARTYNGHPVRHIERTIADTIDQAIFRADEADRWQDRLVVLTGEQRRGGSGTDVNAGKTHAAIHGIQRLLSGYTFIQLRPADDGDRIDRFRDAFTRACEQPRFAQPFGTPRRFVIFIDDLHTYLHPHQRRAGIPLDQHLRDICRPHHDSQVAPPIVVATCRSAYIDSPDVFGLDAGSQELLASSAVRVPLGLDPVDPDAVRELGLKNVVHVTQQLAGRDDIAAKLDAAMHDPCTEAAVYALWLAHAYSTQGATDADLRGWHTAFYHHLRSRTPPDDCFRNAIDWTDDPLGPPSPDTPLLVVEGDHGLRLSDTAAELADPPPIIDVGDPAAAAFKAGVQMHERGSLDDADAWWRRAADHDHTDAMYNLGVVLHRRGETEEAESWWRRAADHDHTDAMYGLGTIVDRRGETEEAESWWRRAADHDHPDAMTYLGLVLTERGETDEAESWWRRAAGRDHSGAMTNLGVMLDRRGETEEAESWWRRAADHDHPDAMTALGLVLAERGETDEAESWWRRAAGRDHSGAMTNLGVMLHRRGETEEAESWWRRAANHDHPKAMTYLGVMLHRRGETEQAQSWWRRAAQAEGPHDRAMP